MTGARLSRGWAMEGMTRRMALEKHNWQDGGDGRRDG